MSNYAVFDEQLRRIWWAITPYLVGNYAVFGERLGINGNMYHGIAAVSDGERR